MLNFSINRGACLVLLAVVLAGCPSAYGPAMNTTAAVMNATRTTSKVLGVTSMVMHTACLRVHGFQTTAYMECIKKDLARLVSYRDNIRPVSRTSVSVTYATLMTLKAAGKKPPNYLATLRPGGCALILGLREWGHKLPDQGKTILPFLTGFLGLACDKPSNAIGLITALIPVAVDLVKWIIQMVGADSAALEREIYDWIIAKPADEVDAMIATIEAALPVSP